MGGSAESKSTTGVFAKAVTNVLMKSSQNCSNSSLNIQEIVFKDIEITGCNVNFTDINQETKAIINLNCAQNIEQNVNLKNDLNTELKNQIEASIGALTANDSKTETVNSIRTEIVNNIDLSTFSSCIISTMNTQRIQFGKLKISNCPKDSPDVTFSNISQKILSQQVLQCIQTNKQLNDLSNKLDTAVTNVQKASSTGLENSTSMIIIIIIIIVLCSLVSSGYALYSSIPGKKGQILLPSARRPSVVSPLSRQPSSVFSDTGLFVETLKSNLQNQFDLKNLANSLQDLKNAIK